MVYGLWSRIPQRNTDNGYIHQCESLWKWIDVIDDHPPIKAIHPCFDHGIPWHLYIMEYLDWMFELNHKDFTYIQPSNQSYSTQILSCFFKGFGVTEKSPFVLLRTATAANHWTRLDVRSNLWMDFTRISRVSNNLGFTSHLRSLSLVDWAIEVSAKTATEVSTLESA